VTIPDGVLTIGDGAFLECIGLEEIVIPDSVTLIGGRAFRRCFDLRRVTIGRRVRLIGEYAFSRCNSLHEIRLPASVAQLGDYAFSRSPRLIAVHFEGAPPDHGVDVFAGSPVTVYYARDASGWGEVYADRPAAPDDARFSPNTLNMIGSAVVLWLLCGIAGVIMQPGIRIARLVFGIWLGPLAFFLRAPVDRSPKTQPRAGNRDSHSSSAGEA
jgi:hypothetical protein